MSIPWYLIYCHNQVSNIGPIPDLTTSNWYHIEIPSGILICSQLLLEKLLKNNHQLFTKWYLDIWSTTCVWLDRQIPVELA